MRIPLHTIGPDLCDATVMGYGISTATIAHVVTRITDK
jgi:hypothetical protein